MSTYGTCDSCGDATMRCRHEKSDSWMCSQCLDDAEADDMRKLIAELTAENARIVDERKAFDETVAEWKAVNAKLTAERDAWRAATGLGNLTPEEAGDKIDAVDEELERVRAERDEALALLKKEIDMQAYWKVHGKEGAKFPE